MRERKGSISSAEEDALARGFKLTVLQARMYRAEFTERGWNRVKERSGAFASSSQEFLADELQHSFCRNWTSLESSRDPLGRTPQREAVE